MEIRGLDKVISIADSHFSEQKRLQVMKKLLTGKCDGEVILPVPTCNSVYLEMSKEDNNKYRLVMKSVDFESDENYDRYRIKTIEKYNGVCITDYVTKDELKSQVDKFFEGKKKNFIGCIKGIEIFSIYLRDRSLVYDGVHAIFGVSNNKVIFIFALKIGFVFEDLDDFETFSLSIKDLDIDSHVLIFEIHTDYDSSYDFYFPVNILTGDYDSVYSHTHFKSEDFYDGYF